MKTISKWANLGAACAASLALVACGGGGGDDEAQTSAVCFPTGQSTQIVNYRVTWQDGSVTTSESTGIWDEPVTLDGRPMLRLQDTDVDELSQGRHITVTQQYYTRNPDGAQVFHAYASASRWANQEQPYYISGSVYDPPWVDRLPAGLRPGETSEFVVQGTSRTTEDGATREESFKVTSRDTYHGLEDVNLPMGRVTTCKTTTVNGFTGNTTILWRLKDKGSWVKREDFDKDGKRTKLMEATSFSER
jgi:hypothetical protein